MGAVGNKDELITFWGQKVKGQGHNETKCSFPAVLMVHRRKPSSFTALTVSLCFAWQWTRWSENWTTWWPCTSASRVKLCNDEGGRSLREWCQADYHRSVGSVFRQCHHRVQCYFSTKLSVAAIVVICGRQFAWGCKTTCRILHTGDVVIISFKYRQACNLLGNHKWLHTCFHCIYKSHCITVIISVVQHESCAIYQFPSRNTTKVPSVCWSISTVPHELCW